ncbi:preprotein translocase subunit SecA [candidate division WOR-3 bacterium]|nr:preprotein translocase subunit SecA [candidate division WOR-3 bacterium]
MRNFQNRFIEILARTQDWNKAQEIIDEMNKLSTERGAISDDELKEKTQEFKNRIKEKTKDLEKELKNLESSPDTSPEQIKQAKERFEDAEQQILDELSPEAFAVVKEVCRRLVGKSWTVTGHEWKWKDVPFDVQLIGAIVLYQSKIAEMATGEGKTLVATMPLYLNSLTGKGCHLITVNDYLASRDRDWMGGIYNFLGVTVGCIQTGMTPEERKPQYKCNITYGTNQEFGFDYLRDNMQWKPEDRVQRTHYYAIVDEVDSALIDEARTPLIISGAVERVINREYARLKPTVARVVSQQTLLINSKIAEAEKLIKEDKEEAAGKNLVQAAKGAPKNRRLMKLKKEPNILKLIEQTEKELMAAELSGKMGLKKEESELHKLQEELYYTIDEKSNIVNITERGREALAPGKPDFFQLPDLSQELPKIDKDTSLSPREKFVAKQAIEREYAEKSGKLHAINQLFKAFSLFNKDVEYVIQQGKVMIVDEFTGRLMPGRRYSDGLHQALEAKEGVQVESETQTLATITIQNYFRMYEKLSGMTGTAETEASEFWDIYKLEVVVIPTNKPVRRVEYDDVIYKTKKEKYDAIMEEIEEMHKAGRPILVGTVSVDVSETLSRMLGRKGIPHQVLNAKYHQKEAEVVALAGQPGKVTIATNMAGRGTDIKLGKGVVKCEKCCIKSPEGCSPEKKECLTNPPCGLHILGTERHEARRIDRQLRGRCARQGDPGSARFYLSLEDNLMRLFGSDRIAGAMSRFGPPDGEPIQHKLVTRAIEGAQKRVERFNFDIRKHLLEYDDIMNKQREAIYSIRNEILDGKDVSEKVKEMINNVVAGIVDTYTEGYSENWNWDSLLSEIRDTFLLAFNISEEERTSIKKEELEDKLMEAIMSLYKYREEQISSETMRDLERQVMLHVLDKNWKDHLYELDALKEGIGLRGYAQRDPLVEYKKESYGLFEELLDIIDREAVRNLFGLRFVSKEERERESAGTKVKAFQPDVTRSAAPLPDRRQAGQPTPEPAMAQAPGIPVGATQQGPSVLGRPYDVPQERPVITTYKRGDKKIGRNDPCPCGSGKKYKNCCGRFVK